MLNKLLPKYIISVLFFILTLCLVATLCRLAFIIGTGFIGGVAGEDFTAAIIPDIQQTLFSGLRYDGRNIASASLAYTVLFFALYPFKKQTLILSIFATICAFSIIFLTVCNIGYYDIYQDTFNAVLLGLIYDDQEAIFGTALSGDYNIILRSIYVIISTAVYYILFKYLLIKTSSIKGIKIWKGVAGFLGVAYLIALMMTSTWTFTGGSLDYLVTPPKNKFFRKVMPGAMRDLHLVYIGHSNTMGSSFENFSGGKSPREAAAIYFDKTYTADQQIDLNEELKKQVETNKETKVKHIFLIVAESLSSWHFMDDYNKSGITDGLKRLASSDKGLMLPHFIENADGTIGTIDTLMTGLYFTNIPLANRFGALPDFSTSCAVFNKLGYDTDFFYFGPGTWRQIDSYAAMQGFNNVYTLADMEGKKRGVWGIYDSEGFDFIKSTLAKSPNKPTFNMVLTVSYHPPYDIPLKQYNVPLDSIRTFFKEKFGVNDKYMELTPEILAHVWYTDKEIEKFAKYISETYPDSLVFITGDHYDRYYTGNKNTLFAKNGVPLIIYGDAVKDIKYISKSGSHIDIIPTIINMVAPNGFEYRSFGRSLLSDSDNLSIGHYALVTDRFIAENNDNIEYFKDKTETEADKKFIDKQLLRLNMGKALSWYIINKGYIIP